MRRTGRLLGLGALCAMTALLPVTAGAAASKYLLSGGNSGSGPSMRYTAPGLGNIYGADFPDTGLGEQAAQIRVRAGKLSKLRVTIVTESATSGSVTLTVRINGAPTALTCTVGFVGGDCGSTATTEVSVGNGDRLAVEVLSTLNQGAWTYTFSLQGN